MTFIIPPHYLIPARALAHAVTLLPANIQAIQVGKATRPVPPGSSGIISTVGGAVMFVVLIFGAECHSVCILQPITCNNIDRPLIGLSYVLECMNLGFTIEYKHY